MYPLESNPTAIQVIQRSMTCHPSTFADAIRATMIEDLRYSKDKTGSIRNAVLSRADQARIALGIVESGDSADLFTGREFMGPGIIALQIACKLQCLPAWIRTSAAVKSWGDN